MNRRSFIGGAIAALASVFGVKATKATVESGNEATRGLVCVGSPVFNPPSGAVCVLVTSDPDPSNNGFWCVWPDGWRCRVLDSRSLGVELRPHGTAKTLHDASHWFTMGAA